MLTDERLAVLQDRSNIRKLELPNNGEAAELARELLTLRALVREMTAEGGNAVFASDKFRSLLTRAREIVETK